MKNSSLGPEYAALGETIREARRLAGVTQVELAQRLGQTQSHLSKCERGEVRLDFVQVRRVCLALDVPFAELVVKFERALKRRR